MKKIVALALAVLMLMTSFVGCKNKVNSDLANAVDYIVNMYQTGNKDEVTVLNADKDVLKVVTVDGVAYDVEWTITMTDGAADAVKISESDKENHVKLDLPDVAETDLLFTATATVKNDKGETAAAEFKYKMTCTLGDLEIVDKAYALEEGKTLSGSTSLTGVVTAITTPYDAGAKTVGITIQVGELTDKLIACVGLQGAGAETLAVGDDLCVSGLLSKKSGVVGFNDGCVLVYVNKAAGSDTGSTTTAQGGSQGGQQGGTGSTTKAPTGKAPSDPKAIVDAAYKLKDGQSLPYTATLTGKVSVVNDLYDAEFGNITVTIQVAGRESKPIVCFRMKGNGIDKIAKGDTITVTGTIKNYKDKIEFDTGCTMTKRVSGGGKVETVLTKPADIVAAAFKLANGQEMAYDVTLTGKVEYIETPYNSEFENITLYFTVEGKSIQCYRMKGNGVDKVKAGDTITVTGRIKNHGGKVEFAFPTMDKRVAGTATTEKTVTLVTSPKTGVAYKFGMVQSNADAKAIYFLDGSYGYMNYYLNTAPVVSKAIDVYLEATTGGYYMYTNFSGSKQYISFVVNGTHVNPAYTAKATTVFTYDSTMQTMGAVVDGETRYFGTAKLKNGAASTYTTIGGVKGTADDIFYCKLYQ